MGESDERDDQGAPEESEQAAPFDAIRREDADGNEYWSARELGKLLGYTEYGLFRGAIARAEQACESSGHAVFDHFAHVSDMIATGKGARRQVEDVRLSRYACYLLVQNADPDKPIVALGQTYFAVQTRRQELEDIERLTEAQKRLIGDSYLSHLDMLNDYGVTDEHIRIALRFASEYLKRGGSDIA